MSATMSEVSERLARIEANQLHTDKQVDRLVSVVEQISKTQADIASIHAKIDSIGSRCSMLESNSAKIADRVAAIDKTAAVNKNKIAAASATIASIVGLVFYWVKSKM